LWEGGARKGVKLEALANYDALVATYRQTVLTAFQGVEDNLAALRILEQEERQQVQAVESSTQNTQLSMNQYRGGIINYLSVITAQALELSNRVTLSNIETRRMAASVLLVQALGGGWNAASLPTSDQLLPPAKEPPKHFHWLGPLVPPGAPPDPPPPLLPPAPAAPTAPKN
jgi:outer membrane protein TolC